MEENEKENNNLDLVGKAKYIFDLCDKEGNGIINKADLLKLKVMNFCQHRIIRK